MTRIWDSDMVTRIVTRIVDGCYSGLPQSAGSGALAREDTVTVAGGCSHGAHEVTRIVEPIAARTVVCEPPQVGGRGPAEGRG